jgi:uncharacterized membrane protein
MKLNRSKPFWQAVGLGILAGMRSSSAPAITSHILSHHYSKSLSKSPLKFMQSDKVAAALKLFAAFEFVGDKLPSTPNRTKPIGVVFRCLSGSLAAASVFKVTGNNPLVGAAIGSVAAFGSTFGSYLLRKGMVKKTGVPDPVIGAVEDALVIGAGVGLVRNA